MALGDDIIICPSVSEVTLNHIGKIAEYHSTTKHNKTETVR